MVNSEAMVSLTFVSYSLIFLVMNPFLEVEVFQTLTILFLREFIFRYAMRGFRGCFNLFSYIICRSLHSLRSDLEEAFSVQSVVDMCASPENNYLYSK